MLNCSRYNVILTVLKCLWLEICQYFNIRFVINLEEFLNLKYKNEHEIFPIVKISQSTYFLGKCIRRRTFIGYLQGETMDTYLKPKSLRY